MAMFDQTQAGKVLDAILHNVAFTTPTTVKTLLGTSAPTATSNMTELSGTGYTTGGTVMTFNAAAAAATSNSSTASWTNGSGGSWSIVGLEIWNSGDTTTVSVRELDRAADFHCEHEYVPGGSCWHRDFPRIKTPYFP